MTYSPNKKIKIQEKSKEDESFSFQDESNYVNSLSGNLSVVKEGAHQFESQRSNKNGKYLN